MKVPPELLSFLREKKDFFIATHINPEGDALGSSLALSMALETLGKKTVVYDRDGVPEIYRYLPGQEKFIRFNPGYSNLRPSTCFCLIATPRKGPASRDWGSNLQLL